MSYPQKFNGIAITDPENWKHPKHIEFDPKIFDPLSVDIKVECCSVCASDLFVAGSYSTPCMKGQVVGHEVVGKIVKLGSKCHTGLKIRQRVGIGPIAATCMKCKRCQSGNESYCVNRVSTYSRPYPDGYISQGGYADYIRVNEHFVIPIPDELPSHIAAPLLCGGITAYSPLLRNGCGPGKKVGIVGIGGIGHMGVILAKAMGAEVYAFSRYNTKKEEVLQMGTDHFIAIMENESWENELADTLDFVLICSNSLTQVPLDKFAKIMTVGGKIVSVAVPGRGEKLELNPFGLQGITIGNSVCGPPHETKQLLDFVVKNKLNFCIETIPFSEEGVHEAFERVEKGDVRYKFTLVDFDKEFSK